MLRAGRVGRGRWEGEAQAGDPGRVEGVGDEEVTGRVERGEVEAVHGDGMSVSRSGEIKRKIAADDD